MILCFRLDLISGDVLIFPAFTSARMLSTIFKAVLGPKSDACSHTAQQNGNLYSGVPLFIQQCRESATPHASQNCTEFEAQ